MFYRQGFLNKLERRFGRFAIKNLMLIIVGAMAIVFLMDGMMVNTMGKSLWETLSFDRSLILQGQVWRVVTFLFLPPTGSLIWIALMLFFYYSIGATLEAQWGAFGFAAYYILGAVGAIIAGFITGYSDNSYLNLSMFLAFAILFPRAEFRLLFLIPVEAWLLAVFDGVLLVWMFINDTWSGRLALIMALVNLLIFFTPHLIDRIKAAYGKWKWNRQFRK